jgi:hypothetical protein
MKSDTSVSQSCPATAPPSCALHGGFSVGAAAAPLHHRDGNGPGDLGAGFNAGLAGQANPLELKQQVVAPTNTTQAVGRPRYEAHIGSIAWKAGEARLGELKASEFRCRTCNASAEEAELQVHHRTYERFGRELQGDLTTLCADCHVVVTDMLRRRRYAVFTPASADVAATDRRAPLFDPMAPGEWS